MVWWESSYSAHSGDPGLVNTTLQEKPLPESFRAGCGSWNTLEVEGPFPSKQTISPFALVIHALRCSPQGVNVVL